jgi:hypothetical protein
MEDKKNVTKVGCSFHVVYKKKPRCSFGVKKQSLSETLINMR